TGTISTKSISWDSSKSALSGSSEIVEGEPYSLFIHVPEGMTVSKVNADVEVLFHKMTDSVLEVKFAGHLETEGLEAVNWTIEFMASDSVTQ
ncbi:MAG: hypothetical protein KAX27_00235, partial [Candidatus Aminicenantes bacterium]|nr:hypothetical protein [Candidatus Aminicenantes bacterium]